MRTILSLALALCFSLPVALSAESAAGWLDRAANPELSLREREYAAQKVLMLADPSASILIAALRGEGSDSGLRRQIAARLLGQIAPPGAEAPLLEAAFDKDYFLAEAASFALAVMYSRRDDDALRDLLRNGLPDTREASGDVPEGDDWIALSLDAARNRGRFRALVMRGLALKYDTLGAPMPEGLVQCVWDGLLDADKDLRLYSVWAAAKSGNSLASEKLATFLYTENNPKLLVEALRAMAEMRPPDYGEAVERHIAHSDPMVALEALTALDAMGYNGVLIPPAPGVRSVAAFVSHPSTPVRRRAVEILAARKNPAVLEYLQAGLFDRVPANRAAAARAMGELGFTGAVGSLNPLLRDGHPEVRSAAAESLARLGVVGVAAGVLDDLAGDSPPFRRAAAATLGRLGDARAVPALTAALNDDDVELVCLAAESLGELGARQAGKELYTLMTSTPDEAAADTARRALLAIYGDDPGMSDASWKSWARRNGM